MDKILVEYKKGTPFRVICHKDDKDGLRFKKTKHCFLACFDDKIQFCHDMSNILVVFVGKNHFTYKTNRIENGVVSVIAQDFE